MTGLHPSIQKVLKAPSVYELARLYPQQTIVYRFSQAEWLQVHFDLEALLNQSGIAGAEHIDCCVAAMDVLTGRLHDIAMRHDVVDYRVDTGVSADGDLEITMVFDAVADAMLIKLALP